MRPYDVAQAHYGDQFADALAHFFETGLVVSDDAVFLLACTVSKDVLSGACDDAEYADCWYVEYLSGDLFEVLRRIDPTPLPYIAFYRGLDRGAGTGPRPNPDTLRIYKMDTIRRHLMGHGPIKDRDRLKAAQKPPLTYGKFESAIDVILKDEGMTQDAHDALAEIIRKDMKARAS